MKPEFIIPTMEEISRISKNGYKVVSTFSGAGGSCLGFKIAGYDVLWANEFIPAAQRVYELNHKETYLDKRDIREVKPEEILEKIGLDIGELDVFEGSPPCASFSTCGIGSKGWNKVKPYSDTYQRVDDLFFEYIRILRGLRPKVFVAENVKGLVQGQGKGYFKIILDELKKVGYNVKVRILDAKYLGVPQSRERVIFIGVREDLNINPEHPEPKSYVYTIKDAIPNILERSRPPRNDKYWQLPNGKMMKLWRKANPKIRDGHWLPVHEKLYKKPGMWNHRTINIDKPSATIVQSSTSMYHPRYPRTITIYELKRLFTFPNDFILSGSFYQQWERIARSVPPLMMYEIAKTIKEKMLDVI